jgi:Tol biopolymer transport system component
VAFTSTRDGNYEVYLMALDGSNQRNVTNNPGRETGPYWMPDGQVAFIVSQQSATGASWRVYRLDDLGGRTAITPPSLLVTDFAVSRSGDLMAMIVSSLSDPTGSNKLYLLQLGAAAGPIEVTTDVPNERFFGVSFRP